MLPAAALVVETTNEVDSALDVGDALIPGANDFGVGRQHPVVIARRRSGQWACHSVVKVDVWRSGGVGHESVRSKVAVRVVKERVQFVDSVTWLGLETLVMLWQH